MLAKFQRKADKPKIRSNKTIVPIQDEVIAPSPTSPSPSSQPKSKPKPSALRLFSLKSKSKATPKSNRSSTISSTTSGASRAVPLPRTRLGSNAYSTLSSPPLSPLSPRVVESVSVWNAAGQDITMLPTRHRNTSSSNLSTTSTLLELPPSTPAPAPVQNPRPSSYRGPSSPVRQSSDSYEAFLGRAQEQEQGRRKESMMAHAWMKAEQRRRESRNWPSDPWRGGFGPPTSGRDVGFVRRDGGVQALSPRKVDSNDSGVRGWLSRNGLTGR